MIRTIICRVLHQPVFGTRMKRVATMGALRRRFERDLRFQQTEVITGPGATHAGPNDSLALRFGSYPPRTIPASWCLFGITFFVGDNVGEWLALSDITYNAVYWNRFGVAWG